MTEKGLICLAVLLFFIVLALAMIALWCISANLGLIARRLGETNKQLLDIDYAHSRAASTIAGKIGDVYRTMFSDAEVTIYRNDKKENEE